jgi:hypothetical protein
MGKSWGSRDPLGAVLNGLERHFQASPGRLRRRGNCPHLSRFPAIQRRGGDSNPRRTERPLPVFETGAFNRSATSPGARNKLDDGTGSRPAAGRRGMCRNLSYAAASSGSRQTICDVPCRAGPGRAGTLGVQRPQARRPAACPAPVPARRPVRARATFLTDTGRFVTSAVRRRRPAADRRRPRRGGRRPLGGGGSAPARRGR